MNEKKWTILAKHFTGETTPLEKQALAEWRMDPEFNNLYNQVQHDWTILGKMKQKFNVDHAWNKLHDKIDRNSTVAEGITTLSRPADRLKWQSVMMRIAAVVVLIAAAGAILLSTGIFSSDISIVTNHAEVAENIYLPDGSVVYLNSGSELTYPKKSKDGNRSVYLSGEAFFEVKADAENPFVIRTNDAVIKAIGTTFNVKTIDTVHQVEVFVESGRVSLSNANDQPSTVLLDPGYIGILANQVVESRVHPDRNNIAWKTKQLQFENTALSDVLDVLQDVYKVEIILEEPDLYTTRIFGEFNHDPLDHILEVICTQNQLKIERSGNIIYLSHN